MAEAGDVSGALAEVDAVAGDLDGYLPLHAARGDLLARLGRAEEARTAFRAARALATTDAERRFLDERLRPEGERGR